jgi:hypothetical protein
MMVYRNLACILLAAAMWGGIGTVPAVDAAPPNMTLAGQLAAITDQLKGIMTKDPLLKNQKLKFGKVVNEDLPDSNFELRLEQELRKLLDDQLDDRAELTLSASYDYLQVTQGDNKGRKVIQIRLKIKDSNGRELAENVKDINSLVREINNTNDIARILGATLAPPDVQNFEQRNEAVKKAAAKPEFATHPERPTAVIAPGQPHYAVELRKSVGGQGAPRVVPPTDERGRAFASIEVGDTYEVVLLNFDPKYDAVAKLEIDGLDTANTFHIDRDDQGPVKYPGYFVPRAVGGKPGEHVVPGWLHTVQKRAETKDNVFQFVVNELGKGAASAKQARSLIGMITVQFFDGAANGEKMRGRNFGETGQGKGMQVDYKLKELQVGTEPLSIIAIRYTRNP